MFTLGVYSWNKCNNANFHRKRGVGVDGDAHRDKGVGMSLSGPYLLEFWFEQITIVWFLNVEMYINSNSNVSPGLVSN